MVAGASTTGAGASITGAMVVFTADGATVVTGATLTGATVVTGITHGMADSITDGALHTTEDMFMGIVPTEMRMLTIEVVEIPTISRVEALEVEPMRIPLETTIQDTMAERMQEEIRDPT